MNHSFHKKFLTKMVLLFFIANILLGYLPSGLNTASAEDVNYPGKDTLPFGSVLKYDFGTATSPVADGYTRVTADTNYSAALGYGWMNPSAVTITGVDENTGDPLKGDYISGNNVRTVGANAVSHITYNCPTFVVDLPVGYYRLHLIQGSSTAASCSGAYIEGSMRILPWSSDDYGPGFDSEPVRLITNPAGSYADNTVTVAVWDGQLTLQISTSITPSGESGTAIINSLEIERIPHNLTPDETPRIRVIGDSTVATYPPFDNPENYAPIPEQTGWGGKLAMFFNGVVVDNWGVGGISARNYITQNYLNRFLLGMKPNDVVLIEWGINEAAAGRRYLAATAEEFDPCIQKYIDAIKAFGGVPVLVSATSGSTAYSGRLSVIASNNNIDYIDLKTLYGSYRSARSSTQQSYLTIDGTHLTRIGGIVAGQIVTNAMKSLTNTSLAAINALNISTAPTAVNTVPAKIPANLRVTAQTKDTVTLSWDISESDIYDPTQLIARFPIYRKAVGADDSTYTEVAEASAYVTADLTTPKLKKTILSTGNYVYAIASRGVNGTSAKSDGLTVQAYAESSADKISNGIKLFEKLFPSDFTIASYKALAAAVDKGKAALSSGTGIDEAANAITAAISGLNRKMAASLFDDFQSVTAENWETTQDPSGVSMTYEISENGDRYLNYYVSASGERSRRKTFADISASKVSLEFEWMPGKPDVRNVTELRFYGVTGASASPANDLYFTLKTANDGHIGYCAGPVTTPVTTSAILYPGVDLGLSNTMWYIIKVDFDYSRHTAALSVRPRDDASAAITVIRDIAIPENIGKLSYMRWHAARGKNDDGVGNSLSVLWSTSIDNFGIYYLPPSATEGDTAALKTALEAAEAKDAATYTPDSFARLTEAIALGDRVVSDFVIAQEDVDYAAAALANAVAGLEEVQPANACKFDFGTGAVASGYLAVTSSAIKSGSNQFGFTGSGMTDFDRGTADALTTDGVNVPAGTEFDVELPNKDYTVTVTYGDPFNASNAGTTTNVTTAADVTTPGNFNVVKKAAAAINANSTRTDTFTVSVLDGILRIIFTGTNINVNAITITPIADRTPGETPTLYITGDSTVTTAGGTVSGTTSKYAGWGKYFSSNITGCAISNKAVAGRGIRGFYSENRMDPIFTEIKPGDCCIIEFGHNDANSGSAGRYSTIPEFKEYLKYTCNAIMAHGATPILITVLTHVRDFNENNPSDSTGYTNAPYKSTSQIKRCFPAYAQAARDIAAELGVACYDLNEESYRLYVEKGIDWVLANLISADGVHPIDSSGSIYFGRMVADGLAAANISGLSDKFLANRTKLQEAAAAASAYDLSKYTAESAAPVTNALNTVNAMLADNDARQTEALSAISRLNAAIAGLKLLPDAEKPTVSLTGSSIVEPDRDFEVGVSLTGDIKSIYAEDITIAYDKGLFDFVKAVPASDKVMLVNVTTSEALRFVAANEGGITGSALILKLTFHTRDVTTQTPSAISVVAAKLGSPLPLPNGTVFDAEKGSLDISITGTYVSVKGVSIDQGDAMSMAAGDVTTLTATITPADATNRTLTWSSGNTAVAAIDAATGEVTAKSAGTAVITVTSADGASDAITITVTERIAGDLNNDGVVDVGDLAIAAYYYHAKTGDGNWDAAKTADVNGDGRVDILDIVIIAKKII